MPKTQWATVQFPDGRRVQRQIPAAMSDRELRGLFAEDYMKSGYDEPGAVVHKDPNPLMGWGQNDWSLSNYKPSLGERLETSIGRALGDTRRSHRFANKAFSFVNDATPVGNATGIDEGGRQVYQGLSRGDLGQAALGAGVFALSALPVPGAAKRATKGIFGNLARNTDGAIRSWHGSPHDFDRFDMSKIGTGEGAEAYATRGYRGMGAYGSGVNLSADREVAENYANEISESLNWYNDTDQYRPHLYEVEIGAEPHQLLDHDAPLSGQSPYVRDAITGVIPPKPTAQQFEEARRAMKAAADAQDYRAYSEAERVYDAMKTWQAMDVGGLDAYRNLIYPGEKHDAFKLSVPGLTHIGDGRFSDDARNYVIFDDQLIDILNKY